MNSQRAIDLMREKADTINLARARMGAPMRTLFQMGGEVALREVFEAELQRIKGTNDNGGRIG